MPKASSGRMRLGASGGGATGNGWVGESTSPGAPPCGTGRSSTGMTGAPVSRSSVKSSPCLVGCSTAGRRLSLPGDHGQRRLGGIVVVPDVVVDGLERPDHLAGLDVQRDDGIGVAVVAGAQAAPEVGAGAGGRQEDEAARLVDRHRRPDVGRAGGDRRIGAGQRIEAPLRRAGDARRRPRTAPETSFTRWLSSIEEPTTTTPRATTGGEVICISPRRCSVTPAPTSTRPVLPKPAQSLPVAASSANSRRSLVFMKMRSAQGAPARRRVAPVGDAAAVVAVGIARRRVDLRVEAPELLAGRRVERQTSLNGEQT